jgi:hypothetical protein
MSVNVEIAGQGAQMRIEVIGYENPAAENPSDANWLTCRVNVRVRAFEGHVDASFTTQGFAAFRKSLRLAVADVRGEAVFETDEDALRLNVKLHANGTAAVTGTLREPDRPQTALAFSFESDQTFLRHTVEALNEVVQQFPERTAGA